LDPGKDSVPARMPTRADYKEAPRSSGATWISRDSNMKLSIAMATYLDVSLR
jgi:hypothetical protein